jgi:hypothetical protein
VVDRAAELTRTPKQQDDGMLSAAATANPDVRGREAVPPLGASIVGTRQSKNARPIENACESPAPT